MSSVTGGCGNLAGSGSPGGGCPATSSAELESVAGGGLNVASGLESAVSGGRGNTTSAAASAIAGGSSEFLSTDDYTQAGHTTLVP